jgi:hypothetical protein
MKAPTFSLPTRKADQKLDQWVNGTTEGQGSQPKAKPARLTIDLDPEVHAKFKAKCALRGTNMVDEVRSFIDSRIAD